jgi:hypothetical protein
VAQRVSTDLGSLLTSHTGVSATVGDTHFVGRPLMSDRDHGLGIGQPVRVAWLVIVTIVFLSINTVPAVADHLEMRWPDVALGGIFFIGLFLAGGFIHAPDGTRDRVLVFNWVLLFVYLIHQFEEHGVDLFGRVYFFHEYAGSVLESRGLELTPMAILRINTLAVWFAFSLAIWGGRRFSWPGLAAAGLVLANGLFHIAIAVSRAEYNPGLVTAIVLFLPISVLYFRLIPAACGHGRRAIVAGIAFGFASHALLPVLISANAPVPALALLAGLPLIANFLSVRLFGSSAA